MPSPAMVMSSAPIMPGMSCSVPEDCGVNCLKTLAYHRVRTTNAPTIKMSRTVMRNMIFIAVVFDGKQRYGITGAGKIILYSISNLVVSSCRLQVCSFFSFHNRQAYEVHLYHCSSLRFTFFGTSGSCLPLHSHPHILRKRTPGKTGFIGRCDPALYVRPRVDGCKSAGMDQIAGISDLRPYHSWWR